MKQNVMEKNHRSKFFNTTQKKKKKNKKQKGITRITLLNFWSTPIGIHA